MIMMSKRCGQCGVYTSVPSHVPELPCQRCDPNAYWQKLIAITGERKPLVFFGSPTDRFQQEHTLVDAEGKFYRLTIGRHPSMSDCERSVHEKNVAELMRIRAENTELLAENARLRRRLEKK